MKLQIVLEPSEDRGYTALVPALPGCISEGDTRDEAIANIQEAVWLDIPSTDLRGKEGRNDNVWLRECLNRLTGLTINGEYRGDPWGAVVIAEWHIEQGGTVTRVLVPPAAIHAIRAPETFAKIEAFAAYKLQGAARRLYAALADKKRMNQKYWVFDVDELRTILGVSEKKSYQRWNNFRFRILDPAIAQINDYGTVTVTITPERVGRAISYVRFDWEWKSIDEARATDEENEQPSGARHMDRSQDDAPPLTDQKTPDERAAFAKKTLDKAGFTRDPNGKLSVEKVSP